MSDKSFATKYGPWAVIAGASEGIGFAFAESCAQRGLNLVLAARRADKLEGAAQELRARYACEIKTLSLDLSAPGAADALAAYCEPLNPGLVVYNAALSPIGPLSGQDAQELEKVVRLNCLGPMLVSKNFAARMAERGHGGIVVVASMAGLRGSAGLAAYSASKAFLVNFAESLWAEMRPAGVDVCACIAGATATPGYLEAARLKSPAGATTGPAGTAAGAAGTANPKPEAYVGSPRVVAETALRGLGKGPRAIPGAVNKIGAFFMQRILSARAAVSLMSKASGGLKRKEP